MAEYIDEWSPSEVDKQQAKVRLVRLDAEGNPVDGSYRLIDYSKDVYYERVASLDAEIMKSFQNKTVSLKLFNLSPETIKLLRGESGDPDPAGDSGTGPADR